MRKLYFIIIFTQILFANTNFNNSYLIKEFKRTTPKVTNDFILYFFNKDSFFQKANEYLYNKKYFIKTKITDGDPEDGEPLKEIEILSPDYKNVVIFLYKSIQKYNNPISAYELLYILNHRYTENDINFFLMKRKAAKVLYENSNNCDGFLYYGKYLLNGIGGKKNLGLAFNVFTKGYDKCEKKEYYKIMFQGYMKMIEKRLNNG